MSKIERSIVIDRPIGEVFEFVLDPTNDALWQTTLVESEVLTEGPVRAGSQIRDHRRHRRAWVLQARRAGLHAHGGA